MTPSNVLLYPLAYVMAMVVHELGHFLAARWYGVRVERFFIFFDANDRALFRWTNGHTVFGIGWLPLGSYLVLSGVERMRGPLNWLMAPLPWELQGRPTFEQVAVILAGSMTNLFIAAVLLVQGMDRSHPVVLLNLVIGLLQLVPFRHSDGWMLVEIICRGSVFKGLSRLFLLLVLMCTGAMLYPLI